MFGKLIRDRRKILGYTQKQLGLLCGYSEASAERMVQHWESDKREPPLSIVRKLAAALQLPLEDLIP